MLSWLKPGVELIQDVFLAAEHCDLELEFPLKPRPAEDDTSSESSSDSSVPDEEAILHHPLWIHEIRQAMVAVGVRPWYNTQEKLDLLDLEDRFDQRMDLAQCHLELLDRAAECAERYWRMDASLYRHEP